MIAESLTVASRLSDICSRRIRFPDAEWAVMVNWWFMDITSPAGQSAGA
ncbi:MAG TPA: hypothetical protein VFN18_10995 [Solirubrobacterales bacterium]|nr:hypothetical protein [Solirubrobacterales bacterium]